MRNRGIPFELVSYTPKRFKHWPPYYGILEMCLTNATLPSKSLGGSSCSLKYKRLPRTRISPPGSLPSTHGIAASA